jgi:hypothetical protein
MVTLNKKNLLNKTRKNKTINHFSKKIHGNFKEDFLSSCFQYYYGNIQLCNKKCKNISISQSFLNIKKSGPLIVIDYPNVIYTLFDEYKERNIVAKYFYQFIYKHLNLNYKFYIIAKNVVINEISFNIDIIFNLGHQLTNKLINKKYFNDEFINIYNLSYSLKEKISSSIDDLLGYFICFIIYVYLVNNNINPNEKISKYFKKLNIITNDRQFFNKNLFGLTKDEIKYKINILKDLQLYKLNLIENKFIFQKNSMDQKLTKQFLNEYMVTTSNDIKNLDCKLFILLQILHNSKDKNNSLEFFSYSNLNELQKKYLKKFTSKKCNNLTTLLNEDDNLLKYYYLYTFIKYVQIHLYSYVKNGNRYGELFGSQKKEDIIDLFSS